MDSKELLTTIKEVMKKYDEYRAQWIEMNGSAAGFDAWFTKQLRPQETP